MGRVDGMLGFGFVAVTTPLTAENPALKLRLMSGGSRL
jgi:hypothetical protein